MKKLVERIQGEMGMSSDDSLYNITSFGTDINLRQLVEMYEDNDIEKPELQRKYVWTKQEASWFIDSVLLGLPVPSIFLAKNEDNKLLIVDGYQRIMTICDYTRGIYSGDGKVFKLSQTDKIHKEWRGKTYAELSEQQQRAIRMYSIHAIIFEQKFPRNDNGMYQIFERINSSGRTLRPQEIRNCVYHGSFNSMLQRLNVFEDWRSILGQKAEDVRMEDVELILRFFAFADLKDREEYGQKQLSLSKYLNDYMGYYKKAKKKQIDLFEERFKKVMVFLYHAIGQNLFRTYSMKDGNVIWSKRVNPVVLDAVCVATDEMIKCKRELNLAENSYLAKYKDLMKNEEFLLLIRQRTTDLDNIRRRVKVAKTILFGVDD